MCIREEDIKEVEAEIELIKNGPKVIKLLYDVCISEEEFDAEIVPALRSLRHDPQDVLFIEDEDGNWSKVYHVEVMCSDDETGTYNILVSHEEKSEWVGKNRNLYYKLYKLAPDENIGLREVIDLLRYTLTDKGVLDLSHWEDVTQELTGQEYDTSYYLFYKYYRED